MLANGEASSGQSTRIVIHDISETGLLIEWGLQLAPGGPIEVELPEQGSTRAVIVWTSGLFAGCRFDVPIETAVVDATMRRSERTVERQFDPETISEIASQLDDLSMAVNRITEVLDRAITQLSKQRG